MRVKNENMLNDSGAIDLSSSWDSNAIWLGHISCYAIQLVFSGTPDGTFKLQASNDQGNPPTAGSGEQEHGVDNWTDITDSSQAVSMAGNHMWDVQNAGYNWVRVVWTANGTGTSPSLDTARAYVKGV